MIYRNIDRISGPTWPIVSSGLHALAGVEARAPEESGEVMEMGGRRWIRVVSVGILCGTLLGGLLLETLRCTPDLDLVQLALGLLVLAAVQVLVPAVRLVGVGGGKGA
ncbi:MAG TPA: hypothetical protein VMY80_00910 [Anaerolineae bacterium]|nr:hypothetical protein [Anaerolineae bacterium]